MRLQWTRRLECGCDTVSAEQQQGPEIRIGRFADGDSVDLKPNQTLTLSTRPELRGAATDLAVTRLLTARRSWHRSCGLCRL